jgi:hypothetical protein
MPVGGCQLATSASGDTSLTRVWLSADTEPIIERILSASVVVAG